MPTSCALVCVGPVKPSPEPRIRPCSQSQTGFRERSLVGPFPTGYLFDERTALTEMNTRTARIASPIIMGLLHKNLPTIILGQRWHLFTVKKPPFAMKFEQQTARLLGADTGSPQTKRPPEGGLSVALIGAVDQATRRDAVWLRRRYAMKPMPAKPRIIMAHVDGSGTAPGLPIPPPAIDRRMIESS
jgi:hypothetical protein